MPTLIERARARGLPKHVALIMDGNGRWAQARGLARAAGHQAGGRAAERLIRFAGRRLGLEYLTLFAFSTENWKRPAAEVEFLMDLLDQFLAEKLAEFVREGVQLRVLGDLGRLPDILQDRVRHAITETAGNDRLHLAIGLNYGSRQEILRACQRVASAATRGDVDPETLDPQRFSAFLDTHGMPDPDLVIRTSGEMRLSNFLLWQTAYAELCFTKTLWPDFTPAELVLEIVRYQERERRFGGPGARDA
jgi:undecaprenyl diphosphate synthase